MERYEPARRGWSVSVNRHRMTPVDTGRHRSRSAFNPRVPGSIPGRPTGQPCFHLRLCTGCTSLLRREPPCGQQAANGTANGRADRSTQPHEVGREVVRLQLGPDRVEASMRAGRSDCSAVIAAVSGRHCESGICGGAVALALAGGVSGYRCVSSTCGVPLVWAGNHRRTCVGGAPGGRHGVQAR